MSICWNWMHSATKKTFMPVYCWFGTQCNNQKPLHCGREKPIFMSLMSSFNLNKEWDKHFVDIWCALDSTVLDICLPPDIEWLSIQEQNFWNRLYLYWPKAPRKQSYHKLVNRQDEWYTWSWEQECTIGSPSTNLFPTFSCSHLHESTRPVANAVQEWHAWV